MKINDIQFIRSFLVLDSGLNESLIESLLNKSVEIQKDGEKDSILERNEKIIYKNPSSLMKFLFRTTHFLLDNYVNPDNRDRFTIALIQLCKDYVYNDYEHNNTVKYPIVVDINKFHSVSVILTDIIEPLVGNIKKCNILFLPSNFVSAVSVVHNISEIQDWYGLNCKTLSKSDFPLIVANSEIQNKPALYADILYYSIMIDKGRDLAEKVIKNLVLDNRTISHYIITCIRTIEGDPTFVIDFFKYLTCYAELTKEEQNRTESDFYKTIESDSFLSKHIKTSAEKYTPQVWKQWSQWSLLVGLIEKQLGPMRGSMWPTSENMKEHDNKLKQMLINESKKLNKKHLNFEEMLTVARSYFNHKTHKPSQVIENLLKDNRVWKT